MVSADAIRTAVGILGNAISLGLFLSPLPTFVRICKKGSVEEFSVVPYVATLLNCMMWVVYGLPVVHPHSTLVLTINGSGMAIELAYVLLFLIYARSGKQRAKVAAILAAQTAFVAAVALVVLTTVHTNDRRSMVVGVLCVVFGAMMYAAPLSVMKMVIETKSVEFMPLTLSLASLFNGLCWTAYALIRFDLYITIPNALGVAFAVAQLVLYAVYYSSTQRQIAGRRRKAAEAEMAEVVVVQAVDANNDKAGSGAAAAK
ncbi:bidirectional sugar transporter SWEET4-like [Zingiber officinale]|nr:bidirectional sugar transporter SWEET4-like [Zingiber officinale]